MRIRVLGGFDVTPASGEPIRFATRKTALTLAALVLAGGRGMPRDLLRETIWPDRAEPQGRGSLRQALADIRRGLARDEGAGLRIDGGLDTVRLAAPAEAVDAWAFEGLIAGRDPAGLTKAADLYGGDLLDGVALPAPLDQWFTPHRHACRARALRLVEDLSLVAGEAAMAACERLAERLLAVDPAAEEAHRALIRLYRRQGRANAALRQFEICREALRRDLDAEPEARTRALLDEEPEPLPEPPVPPAEPPARHDERPSLVVMPFQNLSGPADDHFVDGVVEEIGATLSRVRDFFVVARQSAFAYKGRAVDVREVGRALGVAYVVEGSLRRAGERVRISVQLVHAENRATLWSDRYDGVTADIFALQDSIAARVAGALHPALLNAEIEAARRRPPESLHAYEFVLRAYPRLWAAVRADNREAIALLTEALAVDPHYGRAHALLAWCHSQEVVYLWSTDPERDRARTRAAIEATAGRIDDDPMALAAVGAACSQCLEDQDRATVYTESALALDPNNAWAWARYGWIALYRDELEPARERFERALALSPLDPLGFNFRIGAACAIGLAGDYAQGARLIREVLDKHPQVAWAYRQLAAFSALAGDLDEAREAVRALRAALPGASVAMMKTHHPGRHVQRTFDIFLRGWRLAGLPET